MAEEWGIALVLVFTNMSDLQWMSHTMKRKESFEARLIREKVTSEQQYSLMPRKSATDTVFVFRVLMDKYRDDQKELHCVFVK